MLADDERANLLSKLFESSRLPIILQAEAAECGIACIAMIAWYYGYHSSLNEIRRRFSISLKGTTLKAMMDMADSMGFSPRPIRVELSAISQVKTPAILHWDLRHFVVLKAVRAGKLIIHDPASGVRKITLHEAGQSFTGVVLELTPTETFETRGTQEKTRLNQLFGRAKGLNFAIVQLFGLALAAQLVALLSPLLNQMIVDDVLARGDKYLLVALAVGMVGLLLINQTVTLISGYVNLYLGNQLSFQMHTHLLRHMLRLPVSWFEKRRLGDMISRFNSLDPLQAFFTTSVSGVMLNGVMALLATGMMFAYSSLLASIEVISVLLLFVCRLAFFPWYKEMQMKGLHLTAQVESTFIETLRGARTFKAFGRERERVSVWQNEQAAQLNNAIEVRKATLWGETALLVLTGLQSIVSWSLGANLIISGELTLGMLVAFQAYTSQFANSASGLVGQYFSWRTLGIHLERLADVTHAEVEEGIDVPVLAERNYAGALEVRNVSFRYAEHEPWVLKDANLKIEPGQLICLVGPSGQGKTTLFKLLLGFYEPQQGQILADGVSLKTFGMRTYREKVGVVMQDDRLFSGTIADNIAFFEPDLDMDAVIAAAKAAQVDKDIKSLPMGYMTLVGDMGSVLSGGQKQRVLIARALYRQPTVLLLDEGTANLDLESEKRVLDLLRSLKMTRVFIAHREAAIAMAERLITVSDHQIVEGKTHGASSTFDP